MTCVSQRSCFGMKTLEQAVLVQLVVCSLLYACLSSPHCCFGECLNSKGSSEGRWLFLKCKCLICNLNLYYVFITNIKIETM